MGGMADHNKTLNKIAKLRKIQKRSAELLDFKIEDLVWIIEDQQEELDELRQHNADLSNELNCILGLNPELVIINMDKDPDPFGRQGYSLQHRFEAMKVEQREQTAICKSLSRWPNGSQ